MNRIFPVKRIAEQHQPAANGNDPEGSRDDALAGALGRDPLPDRLCMVNSVLLRQIEVCLKTRDGRHGQQASPCLLTWLTFPILLN